VTYYCGVDIGGTFTDCVVLDERGETTLAKVSSTPPAFYQGFLDVLEAAAAGKPLIATNVGGIPEIFGPQAAHLVPPSDPAALAKAIAAALDNPAAADRAARVLQQRIAASFCVEDMVDAVLASYEQARRAQALPLQLHAPARSEQQSLS